MRTTGDDRDLDCPWPGPIPYGEADADDFLGRELDIEKLLGMIGTQNLNILIALSGVGKSSLLQAGLIPALRIIREATGEIGPVLLVREWAGLHEISPALLLLRAIRRAALSLVADRQPRVHYGDRFDADAAALASAPYVVGETSTADEASAMEALLSYVGELCGRCGGLVLVVDQAEELLGSGLSSPDQEIEQGVLRVLSTLFRRERRLKLLVSLREEYLGRISLLARDVEGLDKRIHRLEPLPHAEVRGTLLQVSELSKNHVTFASPRVVDDVLHLLGRGESGEGSDQTPVDLLRLQALLVEIFRFQKRKGRKQVVIDEKCLDEFHADIETNLQRKVKTRELARHALENYVERLVREADVAEPPQGPGRRLMKRALVRMAPWLSSPGGFKRHVTEEELVFNALRDDLEIVGVTSSPEEVREAVVKMFMQWRFLRRSAEVGDVANSPDAVQQEAEVELPFRVDRIEEAGLSGEALLHERMWTPVDAVSMLIKACFEVLLLLCDKGVLKRSQGRNVTYELVHDGFGPALLEWAEREKSTLADTLSSVVARRGETFRWRIVVGQSLLRVSWLGCNLNDVELRSVKLTDCVLRGTIFSDSTLEGCTFENCDMRGIVFEGGSCRDVTFKECQMSSSLFRACTWDGVTFRNSVLDNSTFLNLTFNGRVMVEDCSLQFSQIFPVISDGKLPRFRIEGSDLLNAFVGERRAKIGEDCNEDGLLRRWREPQAPRLGSLAQKGRRGAAS